MWSLFIAVTAVVAFALALVGGSLGPRITREPST